jgi:hypothetical protein
MRVRPRRKHGSPATIRIPRHKSLVHVLARNGVACDEFIEITVPAKTIKLRD